jgi:hypothetical protein
VLPALAHFVFEGYTWRLRMSSDEKDPVKEYLRKLGRKGGKARAKKLTPEERSASARKAVQARWARKKKEHPEGN